MSSWVRRGCLNWEGADILLSVRLQCFLSFQMTKASLSCIWELLGICLLLNPRAHALGRRLRQKQAHMASIRGGTPGSACPTAGVQEETGRLQHRQRKRVPTQLPGGGAGLREALWVEGSFVSIQQGLKGKGRPGLRMHRVAYRPQESLLLPLQLSILQSQLEKPKKK